MDRTPLKRRTKKDRSIQNGNIKSHQSYKGLKNGYQHATQNSHSPKKSTKQNGSLEADFDETHSENGNKKSDHKKEKCSLMPKKTIWLIWLMTLTIRIYIISRKDSGWILHPDEVFQSIEVAHGLVYGYGFRPYEYLSPPSINATSAVERQEAATGMYSLRSFLYPKIFAIVLWSTEGLGLSANPFYVCRLFHTVVAAHLPVAVYCFVLELTAKISPLKYDAALLSAICVAFSEHLSVFGTHSLVNSFVSPILFATLAVFIKMMNSITECDSSEHPSPGYELHSLKKLLDMNGNGAHINGDIKQNDGQILFRTESTNTQVQNGIKQEQKSTSISFIRNISHTFNCFCSHYLRFPINEDKPQDSHTNHNFTSKYIRNTSNNDVPTAKIMSRTKIDPAVKLTIIIQRFIIGIIFGILIYIRVDTILVIGTISLIILMFNIKRIVLKELISLVIEVAIGFITGLTLGGFEDKLSYGEWFLAPYQWFCFNVKTGLAGILFGSQNLLFYVNEIYFRDMRTMVATVTICIYSLGITLVKSNDKRVPRDALLKMLLTLLSLLTIYSIQEHKEMRFVHNLFVLNLIIVGVSLSAILNAIPGNSLKGFALFLVVSILGVNLHMSLPTPKQMTNLKYAYLDSWDSNYINECLQYVGNQPDATGVFLDRSIHVTGGYSVLHKNIPIFSLVHYEFQEFGNSTKSSLHEYSWIGGDPIEMTRLNRISNFITTENSPLLLRYLIEQKEYNYLVVKSNRDVLTIGYQEVFSSGTMRVLKRTFDKIAEEKLQKIASSIPFGQNATILEYEGSWLHTFGLQEKAIERLNYALKLGNPRIRTYQILSLSYSALGQTDKAQDLYEECLRIHGNACSYPQKRVVLHSEYNLNLTFSM